MVRRIRNFSFLYDFHSVADRIYSNTGFLAMPELSVPAVAANLAAGSNEETSGPRPTFASSPQSDFVFEVLSERQDAQFARLADKIETSLSRVLDALLYVLQNSNKRETTMNRLGMRQIISLVIEIKSPGLRPKTIP